MFISLVVEFFVVNDETVMCGGRREKGHAERSYQSDRRMRSFSATLLAIHSVDGLHQRHVCMVQ